MAISSTVYSCPFFKEIKSDRFFISQKTINMVLFADCCTQNFFFSGDSVFPLQGCLFKLDSYWQIYVYPIHKYFCDLNMFLYTHLRFFCKFYMVCTSQPWNIWWQTSVQVWSALFDLPLFWIASKEIFLWDWNNFDMNQF